MNQTTITTTPAPRHPMMARRQPMAHRLRQRMRHAAIALCTLLALVASSCTADPFDGSDPAAGNGNAPGTNPDGTITFAVAPRPGFTEVAATRAGQTDNATRWQTGDIVWIYVYFYQNRLDDTTFDAVYISALKYDVDKWRYLTETEAEDLNTDNIPGFTRLMRWPHGSKEWVAPGMKIQASYVGSGKPDADGKLMIKPDGGIPTTPLLFGISTIFPPEVNPVPLKFYPFTSRVRIPAGYKVELTKASYCSSVTITSDDFSIHDTQITEIPARSENTDVFLQLSNLSTATLTRDNVSYTFTFDPIPGIISGEAPLTNYNGASYTLTPYTSGTQTPVAGYDLTIATETELREFARAVNAGEEINGKPAAELRVLQTENIKLTKEWVPIGNADYIFRGAYNGNGKTITGLTMRTAPQPTTSYDSFAGLFGYTEGAVLTGINLREVEINIPQGSDENDLFVGSIAGSIKYSTLSLCSADGAVNASSDATFVYVGGIAGHSFFSTISRCRADVETKAVKMRTTSPFSNAYAGGIAGQNNTSFILSCETQGKAVTAEKGHEIYAGGITGHNSGLIAFCRTGEATVTARNATGYNYAGGLTGSNYGYLYSCYSRATVEVPDGAAGKKAGAIVGFNIEQNRVQHCYATGATDKGTSNLSTDPVLGIVYNANPGAGDIFGVMTNYTGKVESLIEVGTPYYPFTTTYNPSATPAYGIIPQRAVWKKGAWKAGTDPLYPEIDMDYEGE